MKKRNIHPFAIYLKAIGLWVMGIAIAATTLLAQDPNVKARPIVKKTTYTKSTFGGNLLIDNQTVMVPIKGTFEFAISHRFTPTDNGLRICLAYLDRPICD